jgi:hypothetical protein
MGNRSIGLKALGSIIVILLLTSLTYYVLFTPESDSEPEPSNNSKNGKDVNPIIKLQKNIDDINNRTLAWVETLDVNPIKLRDEMEIKGKKKFVELLDVYLGLYQTTDNISNKEKYKSTVENLTQITYNESYHDLNEVPEQQLREDSTSYLRAWYIMRELGLDTIYYEEQIEAAKQRIDEHLPYRGTNQKMAFVFYYKQLGYSIEYSMEGLFKYSEIRNGKPVENLTELEVYYITHEVFFLHDDDLLEMLTIDDLEYINKVLEFYVNFTINDNNVDLLAELLMIMTYLSLDDFVEFNQALEHMLDSQNENGSFGDYEYVRELFKEDGIKIDVDIYLYLHTTEVSVRALNDAAYLFGN